jgi:protease-4
MPDNDVNQTNPSSIPQIPPKKRGSGLKIFLIIIGIMIVFFVGMSIVAEKVMTGLDLDISGDSKELIQKVIVRGSDSLGRKVALITINGAIDGVGSRLKGSGTLYEATMRLHQAAEDNSVKAVLLAIDSPGGRLTASDVIYNEVLKVKASGKPVVVAVGNLAASGGLYIAAGADWIVASPTSLVGSIGVIMNHMVFEELLDKIGIDVNPIKSTGSKDIGSPYRKMTPEETKFFQDLISTFHDRFVNIISEGRGLEVDKVRTLASGKIYTAEQSLEYGLIDQIGYFESALDKIKELSDIESPTIIEYNAPFDFKKAIKRFANYNGSANLSNQAELFIRSMVAEAVTPEIKAIWTGE